MTLKDKIDIIFKVLGFLVSSGTLILAWIIMKKFQRQQISIKQLDKVTELIDYLNNRKIDFLFGYSTGNMFGGDKIKMSLFEIKSMSFNDSDFMSSRILLDYNTKGIIDISDFVNNPLIPKDISDELKNFNSWMGTAIYINDLEKECQNFSEISGVIINSDINGCFTLYNVSHEEKYVYVAYGAFACNDWNNFKECSKNLEKSIRNWLTKYNICEIKIIE